MNVDLLKRVQDTIMHAPERFSVAHWAFARNAHEVVRKDEAPDGFKCCIAGHVLLEDGRSDERGLLCRSGLHNNDGSLYQRAGEACGFTEEQRLELFFPSQWDAPFKQEYYLCGRNEEAAVCAAYIDYFMDKHGAARDRQAQADLVASQEAPAEAERVAVPA